MKKLWKKLIDKLFGKRCECVNKKKKSQTVFTCEDCGKTVNG
mgnify:CR=1 FL=1